MENAIPYLIGLFGLIIAVAGVFKGALDKSELRLELAYSSVEDCQDDLKTCRAENLLLRELVKLYVPPNVQLAITAKEIQVSGDIVGGNKQVGRDSIQRD